MHIFSKSLTSFIESYRTENESEIFSVILNSINEDFDYSDLKRQIDRIKGSAVGDAKMEALDMLLSYADFVLSDGVISETELRDFTFLKRIFKIKEGDFSKYKKEQVVEILKKEFLRIYSDHYVNEREQLLNLNLQSLFSLSYDEFEEFKKEEIIVALQQGANSKDLDIAKIPKGFKVLQPDR